MIDTTLLKREIDIINKKLSEKKMRRKDAYDELKKQIAELEADKLESFQSKEMLNKPFEKGEALSDYIMIEKVKNGNPTVISINGRKFIFQHKDQYKNK